MILYKVICEKSNTVIEYHLQYSRAQHSLKEIMVWITGEFHIESQVLDVIL